MGSGRSCHHTCSRSAVVGRPRASQEAAIAGGLVSARFPAAPTGPPQPKPSPSARQQSGAGNLGYRVQYLDPALFSYPSSAMPYQPEQGGKTDARLARLRTERGYDYADIVTISPQGMNDFAEKTKAFWVEHFHDNDEIRYVLGGSGFFDVRGPSDRWIRLHVQTGDLVTVPEGMHHRFSLDKGAYMHVMRLFKGSPVWKAFNRPQEDHPSRRSYLERWPVSHQCLTIDNK
eukprot:gb/GEZN01016728.1/.p1 GENE.gb/GEZN01016728.1/~~gb/GEZN01016728.1/.p1  ORF type:complete len:231 (-),score=13.35 gb/GEZN01016728.1/:15-707(-)